jgi:hypothetical protein
MRCARSTQRGWPRSETPPMRRHQKQPASPPALCILRTVRGSRHSGRKARDRRDGTQTVAGSYAGVTPRVKAALRHRRQITVDETQETSQEKPYTFVRGEMRQVREPWQDGWVKSQALEASKTAAASHAFFCPRAFPAAEQAATTNDSTGPPGSVRGGRSGPGPV